MDNECGLQVQLLVRIPVDSGAFSFRPTNTQVIIFIHQHWLTDWKAHIDLLASSYLANLYKNVKDQVKQKKVTTSRYPDANTNDLDQKCRVSITDTWPWLPGGSIWKLHPRRLNLWQKLDVSSNTSSIRKPSFARPMLGVAKGNLRNCKIKTFFFKGQSQTSGFKLFGAEIFSTITDPKAFHLAGSTVRDDQVLF